MIVAAMTAKINASTHSRVFDFFFFVFLGVEAGLLSVFVAMGTLLFVIVYWRTDRIFFSPLPVK
jgi:NADH:ubiquinone oxidoreductase subunit 4 (subunit M)